MKIAVRRILMLGALLSPTALYALGLGDIRLKSALNQPFDAEIQLVDATAEDLAALRASIASNDTFVRYGLERPAFLGEFAFEVTRGASGQEVLRVTSARPVTEPFVTFLIDASWPRGRLVREYTVLLDPPVFAPGPAVAEAPVATPQVSTPAPRPAPAETYVPPPPPPQEARTGGGAVAPSIEAGSTYRVQPNDTLWRIASDTHPGSRADVNRAMLAIYQANPQAFDGNINVLRAGSELSIPDAATVGQIAASDAAAEVARQYRQWREASGRAGEDAARLRLVTPEQGSAAASTAVPSTPAAAAGGASAELQSRVQQLEAELAEARRLLEVRNAELASLQGQAVQPAPAPETAEPEPAPVEPVAEAPAEAPVETAPVAEAPVAEPVPAPVAEEPKARPAEPVREPTEPSLLQRILKYWWALGALALGLLALLFVRSRRRDQGSAAERFDEAFATREGGDLRERPLTPRREPEILVEEKRPVEPMPRPKAVPTPARPTETATALKPVSLDETISTDSAVSIEAGDPLAEADFHMAYGLYDQAADLVQLAIKREPQRRDLKLKLLEIFFVWGNRDRFLEVAREMRPERASMSASEWDKVLIMGKQIAPEDTMFAQAASSPATSVDMELAETQQLTDLDFLADAPETTSTDIELTGSNEIGADSTGIDFILDEPLRGSDLASLAPTIEASTLDSSSVDPTAEVPLENLGLDVDEVGGLDEDAEDLFAPMAPAQVEDTIERPARTQVEDTVERPGMHRGRSNSVDEDEEDTLNQTGIRKSPTTTLKIQKATDSTGVMPVLESTGVIPALEATGELPTIETTRIQQGIAAAKPGIDFALGDEPATMSEVGTKLDLARAYIDMGDPEGARSILEEVLQEGSNTQKQEAQRLMSSLP